MVVPSSLRNVPRNVREFYIICCSSNWSRIVLHMLEMYFPSLFPIVVSEPGNVKSGGGFRCDLEG
jgi:hypothetical protein